MTQFHRRAVLTAAAALLCAPGARAAAARPKIALTYDDVVAAGHGLSLPRIKEMNARLLRGLRRHRIPAVGFVNERTLGPPSERTARIRLLGDWLAAGMELGNHTFSHLSLNDTPLADFQADLVKGETATRPLVEARGGALRWFRHPFLHVGRALDKRRAFEAWLTQRGYRVAPVTIENADYIYAAVYCDAKTRGDRALMRRTADDYLAFTERKFVFFEDISRRLFGRNIDHVLLLHDNELNAAVIDRLAALIQRRGYDFAPLEAVLRDPAYASPDTYAGGAGVTWLFYWGRTAAAALPWRDEPEPPPQLVARAQALAPEP